MFSILSMLRQFGYQQREIIKIFYFETNIRGGLADLDSTEHIF